MVTFLRVSSSALYVSESHASDPREARLGLVLDDPGPASVSYDQVSDRCTVVVWDPAVDWNQLLASLGGLVSDPGRVRVAFFAADLQRAASIKTEADGTLSEAVSIGLRGASYSVRVAIGSRARPQSHLLGFDAPSGRRHEWFFTREGGGNERFGVDGPLVLPLEGEGRGALRFSMALEDRQLDVMGAHLRYFQVGPLEEEGGGILSAGVTGHRYPVLRQHGGEPVTFAVRFDPLAPGDPGRTALHFAAGRRLATDFETVLGHGVTLRPLDGAALVLDRALQAVDETGLELQSRSYLTPSGAFEIGLDGPADGPATDAGPHLLVTGVSTSEFVPFRPGDRLVFHPKRPATDRRTLPPGAAGAGFAQPAGAGVFLSDLATTAWVSIETAGAGLAGDKSLHTQPEELTLYRDGSPAGGGSPRSMVFDSQERPGIAGRPFPMVPFLGVRRLAGDAGPHLEQEASLISPARQAELPAASPPAGLAEGQPAWRSTPQGFPVILRDGQWRKAVLARTARGDFGFENMEPVFTRALVRDRTFLVATRLGAGLADVTADLDLAGWGLGVKDSLEGAASGLLGLPPTTLVIKYHDRSLASLLEDGDAWIEKEDFNADWRQAQNLLRTYLETTRQRHRELEQARPGSSPYGPFLRRIDDPAWNGVVALNASVVPEELPKSIKGLLPGIDLERFRAHHFGVELSRLGQEGFDLRQSSLFGVIDYPMPPQKAVNAKHEGIADLEVETLRLQFESSEVRRFDCRVRLWLGEVFGDGVRRLEGGGSEPAEDNVIAFDGRYESRLDADGRKVETYTFVHEGDYRYEFPGSTILKEIRITRLQLTTVDAEGTKVKTRVALWGTLAFRRVDALDLFSIDRLELADLGITIDFDFDPSHWLRDFRLDLGALRFELPDLGLRDGLLGKLPFRLKSFHFSPGDFDLKLPDLGFFSFGPGGSRFRFGLGFHLDLGSLGALAKKLGGFVLETLLGWLPDSAGGPKFAFGFKLHGTGGGGFDLGLQGVLKLLVERYKVEKVELPAAGGQPKRSIYALQAVNCRLEVLNRRFPDQAKLQLFLFVDPSQALAGRFGKVGWLGKLTSGGESTGGLKLPLVALGQRVNAYPPAGVSTARQVVDHIKDKIGELKEAGELASLFRTDILEFAPEREWTVALRTVLWDLADLDLVFLDPDLYGIHLRVPASGSLLFELDVLYRRIRDDLGVYAVELTVPDAWRQMEFGAFSLTLPVIGLDIYTNGDFQIDVGYPWNRDFSRSCSVQVLPFLGSGGFYYAQLNAASSPLVPEPRNPRWTYDPVVQSGFAARFGLGKEFRKGPLRAGLAVTAFATLEGAWGRRRELPARTDNGALMPPADYFLVAGTTGVLGEVYGYVDFGIVKAGVDVRVWVAFGWVLETWQPVVLSVEAGVSVRVRVVIGRIKIFGKKIEIKITFRFSTRLRFEWTLGKGDRDRWNSAFGHGSAGLLALPEAAAAVGGPVPRALDWNEAPELFASPPTLELLFTPDVTLVDGNPHAVLLLTLGGGPESQGDPAATPFAALAKALASWALWTCFPERRGQGEVTAWRISNQDLRLLAACLALPGSLARGHTVPEGISGFAPLDLAALLEFFGRNFRFRLRAPGDGETLGGAVFPMFPDLALTFAHGATAFPSVELWRENLLPESYEETLDRHFERLRILLKERSGAAAGLDEKLRPVSALLFEDYFQLLMRSLPDALLDTHGDDEPAPALAQRFARLADDGSGAEDSGWARLAASIGRFFLHGLRVPDPSEEGVSHALFRFAGQQRPFFPDGLPATGGAPYRLDIEKRADSALDWLEVEVEAMTVDVDALRRLASTPVPGELLAVEVRSPIRPRPRRDTLQAAARWRRDGEDEGVLWSLPPEVRSRLSRKAEALTVHRAENGSRLDNADGPAVEGRWATRLPLRVARIPRGDDFLAQAYRLLPMGDAQRRSVTAILDSSLLTGARLHLLLPDGDGFESRSAPVVELWRTDLSTEPRPQAAGIAGPAEDELRVAAGLADTAAFLDLLRRASIVRSDGYFLGYRSAQGGRLPESLFESGSNDTGGVSAAELTLLVVYATPADVSVSPPVDAVVLAPGSQAEDPRSIFYLRSPSHDFDLGLPLGSVGFRAYRRQPERTYRRPPALESSGLPATGLTRTVILEAAGATEDTAAADALLAAAGGNEVELATRFHLLDYEVAASGPFAPVKAEDVLPISPSEVAAREAGSEPRQRPVGVEVGDWCWEHVLPAHQLATTTGNRSVYAGVGADLAVRLGLRDLYGNRLGLQIEHLTVPVRYFDRLLPMSEWPSVTVGYRFDPEAPGELVVDLRFDPRGFLRSTDPEVWLDGRGEDRERVEDVRSFYRLVKDQLDDPNTGLFLSTTLGGGEPHKVARRRALAELVEAVDAFLAGLPDSGLAGPAVTSWSESVPVTVPEGPDLLEIRSHFHLVRPLDLVHDKAVEHGLTEVWQQDVPLPPRVATEGGGAESRSGLQAMAEAFEVAFPAHKLAVGLGWSDPRALWAVHRRVVSLEVDPGRGRPSAFALPPLSTELLSGDLEIPGLEPGQPAVRLRVTDVDLDVHARSFLRDVEAYLEPDVASFARRLEPAAFDGVVRDKDRMAESLAGGLIPVFANPDAVPDRPRVERIRRLLRDRLAADLRDGYDVDATVLVPLRRSLPGGDGGGAFAFGRLVTEAEAVRLIPGNLDLVQDLMTLPLLVDALRETEQGHVRLDDLVYRLTHVGRHVGDEPEGTPRVAWVQLLRPVEVDLSRPRIEMDVPIPIRRYPELPTLRGHGQAEPSPLPAGGFEERVAAVRRWTYEVDFDHRDVIQDTAFAEIRYNHGLAPAGFAADQASLLAALTGYHHYRDGVWSSIRGGMAGAIAEDEARKALRHFGVLVRRVTGSLSGGAALSGERAALRERFRIDEDREAAGRRRLRICHEELVFDGSYAVLPTDADGIPLPVEDSPPVPDGCVGLLYTPVAHGPDARVYRRLLRRGLDVLRTESSWAGVELWRNFSLVEGELSAEPFVYRTPPVRFGEPHTPYVEVGERIDVPRSGAAWQSAEELRRSLTADLRSMLETVAGPALADRGRVTLELRWGFESGVLSAALGISESARAPHPIGMMPPFELVSDGETGGFTATAAAARAADLLVAWWQANPPPGGGRRGTFVCDLRIYGRLQISGRPILRLRRLVLPLAAA